MPQTITTNSYRIGMSNDDANNFDLEPDGVGSLLIKRASTGLVVGKVDAGGSLLGKVPAFSVVLSTPQGIPTNNAITQVWLNTKSYDIGGYFSLINNRYMPSVAGVFHFSWSVYAIAATGPVIHYSMLRRNGVLTLRGEQKTTSAGDFIVSQGSGDVRLNGSTDYVDLAGFIAGNGSDMSFPGDVTLTYLTGHLVSADL